MGRLENCTKEARGTTIVRALASWLAWVSDQLQKQKTLTLQSLSKSSENARNPAKWIVFVIVRTTRASTPQSSVCVETKDHDDTIALVECEHSVVVMKHVMRMHRAMKERGE
jgi:hypothetical protein